MIAKFSYLSVPFGDSLFLNGLSRVFFVFLKRLSVPFGDSLFLNVMANITIMNQESLSVPFGDSLFLNKNILGVYQLSKNFPSPSGTLYSSMQWLWTLTLMSTTLSVPFGDSLFLNNDDKIQKLATVFLSVPFGDSLFLNLRTFYVMSDWTALSVPFGDSLFLNIQKIWPARELKQTFRPLRGLSIPQSNWREPRTGNTNGFPSPSGTLYSSITEFTYSARRIWTFRPLRGLSIPQFVLKPYRKKRTLTFRPLRGLSIPQSLVSEWLDYGRFNFPSPSGTLYSSIHESLCRREVNMAFRPLRGLSIPQSDKAWTIAIQRYSFRPLRGLSIPQSWPRNLSDFLGL